MEGKIVWYTVLNGRVKHKSSNYYDSLVEANMHASRQNLKSKTLGISARYCIALGRIPKNRLLHKALYTALSGLFLRTFEAREYKICKNPNPQP